MKIAGIVLVVLGGFVLIGDIYGLSTQYDHTDIIIKQLVIAIGLIGLGIYLINRTIDKKKEQEDKEKWDKSVDIPLLPPKKGNGRLWGGVMLITIGGLFLISNFVPNISLHEIWPVILIVVGVMIILNKKK
jgi:ABC-type uncharacterized transport system permease subunit